MRTLRFLSVLLSSAALTLSSCGGGGGGGGSTPAPSPSPTPTPTPTPSPTPDFSSVRSAIDASAIANVAVLVGDDTGALFSYEKGSLKASDAVLIASASKMVFGLGIWQLVENGTLSRTTHPQDHIGFWTSVSGDGRSEITLDQLMGFLSGFNTTAEEPTCAGDTNFTLSQCVESIYNSGLDTQPGDAFAYGPDHMQVAALMMQSASAQSAVDVMSAELFTPLGLSAATFYPASQGDNPRFSGNLRSSGNDYGKILTALLAGQLTNDLTGYLEDRRGNSIVFNQPNTLTTSSYDWHYGWGFWIECPFASFQDSCRTNPVISSPGAFGFTPWVDFNHQYWGVIAMQETNVNGQSGSAAGVQLEQTLQPLIIDALK